LSYSQLWNVKAHACFKTSDATTTDSGVVRIFYWTRTKIYGPDWSFRRNAIAC